MDGTNKAELSPHERSKLWFLTFIIWASRWDPSAAISSQPELAPDINKMTLETILVPVRERWGNGCRAWELPGLVLGPCWIQVLSWGDINKQRVCSPSPVITVTHTAAPPLNGLTRVLPQSNICEGKRWTCSRKDLRSLKQWKVHFTCATTIVVTSSRSCDQHTVQMSSGCIFSQVTLTFTCFYHDCGASTGILLRSAAPCVL